jgi:hypothetical protein
VKNLYLAVLAVVACRNYAWGWFEPAQRGIVSKGLGAATILYLLILLYRAQPSKALGLVVAYGAFEELQTIICSAAYFFKPWEVPQGQSICSARLDFDLGAIGVMFLALTLHKVCLPVRPDSTKTYEKR